NRRAEAGTRPAVVSGGQPQRQHREAERGSEVVRTRPGEAGGRAPAVALRTQLAVAPAVPEERPSAAARSEDSAARVLVPAQAPAASRHSRGKICSGLGFPCRSWGRRSREPHEISTRKSCWPTNR